MVWYIALYIWHSISYIAYSMYHVTLCCIALYCFILRSIPWSNTRCYVVTWSLVILYSIAHQSQQWGYNVGEDPRQWPARAGTPPSHSSVSLQYHLSLCWILSSLLALQGTWWSQASRRINLVPLVQHHSLLVLITEALRGFGQLRVLPGTRLSDVRLELLAWLSCSW